jgi:hypothetical protein
MVPIYADPMSMLAHLHVESLLREADQHRRGGRREHDRAPRRRRRLRWPAHGWALRPRAYPSQS